ncbi:MAG: hypothetical protein AB7G38_00180 [Dehalococcoidia bacterium]
MSVAVLGAVVSVWLSGLAFDVYAQIGLVVLIALEHAEPKGPLSVVLRDGTTKASTCLSSPGVVSWRCSRFKTLLTSTW